ncbi:O-antigen ligase family protein [Sphingomonas morindae]|uniref:O-antigen ligase family protein n=1 Tax=Sphingomonas morindae TaxID=1541170 RepID=A0ABY4X6B8_9SPHN|nr:O-antigen ligase family protein [Sphingomonas morindae]USI72457.1 O-antigen ligase family protein [Sphingomonas morindae]
MTKMMSQGALPWSSTRVRAAVALLPLLTFAELLALGANGPVLAVLAAMAEIAAALLVLLLLWPGATFWRAAAPGLIALGLVVLWGLVPVLAPDVTPTPDLALPGFVRLAGGAAMLMAAGIVGHRRGLARRAVDWLVLLGILQMLIGLMARQIDPSSVFGYDKSITGLRFSGTMINANASGCVAAVTTVLAFGRVQALLRDGPARSLKAALARIGCVLGVLLGLGVITISGSRAGLTLALVALAVMVLRDTVVRRALGRGRGLAFLFGTAALAILLGSLLGATAIHRFVTLGDDSFDRIAIWRHYAALARAAPTFGYGLIGFEEMNRATLHSAAEAFSFWYINSAHNSLIEMVLEGGWPYAVLLSGTVLLMFVVALRGLKRQDDPVVRAAFVGLAIIGAASTVDITLDVPAIVTLGAVLLGLLWGRGLRASARRDQEPGWRGRD